MPEKKKFMDQMEEKLTLWKSRIDEGVEVVKERSDKIKEQTIKEMDALSDNYEKIRYQMTLLSNETGDKWEDLKTDVEKGVKDLKKNYVGSSRKARLEYWKEQMDEALDTISEKSETFAKDHEEDFQKVKDNYEKARYQMTLLKGATADAWDENQEKLDQSLDELKKNVSSLLDKKKN
ncbi:MAG: hypothetical protein ACNI27_08945 [Desulfovibrio sp.]